MGSGSLQRRTAEREQGEGGRVLIPAVSLPGAVAADATVPFQNLLFAQLKVLGTQKGSHDGLTRFA